MQSVLIIHEVADYPAWKAVFDRAADIRRDAGERSYQVLKFQRDPNRIVHFSAWTSIADARRFFESPELVNIRSEAGGRSPDFIYLEQLEAGTLWFSSIRPLPRTRQSINKEPSHEQPRLQPSLANSENPICRNADRRDHSCPGR